MAACLLCNKQWHVNHTWKSLLGKDGPTRVSRMRFKWCVQRCRRRVVGHGIKAALVIRFYSKKRSKVDIVEELVCKKLLLKYLNRSRLRTCLEKRRYWSKRPLQTYHVISVWLLYHSVQWHTLFGDDIRAGIHGLTAGGGRVDCIQIMRSVDRAT